MRCALAIALVLVACDDAPELVECPAQLAPDPNEPALTETVLCTRPDGIDGICLPPPYSGASGITCKPLCLHTSPLCDAGQVWATYNRFCYCELSGGGVP